MSSTGRPFGSSPPRLLPFPQRAARLPASALSFHPKAKPKCMPSRRNIQLCKTLLSPNSQTSSGPHSSCRFRRSQACRAHLASTQRTKEAANLNQTEVLLKGLILRSISSTPLSFYMTGSTPTNPQSIWISRPFYKNRIRLSNPQTSLTSLWTTP